MNLGRLHMRLNLNKVTDPLMGPIILHEYLKDSKLIQGWVRLPGSKLCWHVWVEHETKILDIHALTVDVKPDYVYEATEAFDSDSLVLDTLDLYRKSPKDYWKTKAMGIRSKLLTSLRT